jgi:hypothetical protein
MARQRRDGYPLAMRCLVLAPLLLSGCFYIKFQGGYAPPVTAAPAAASLSFHEGIIGNSSVEFGTKPLRFDLHWFGEDPWTWSWGAFARARGGVEQAQLALGPELAIGLNPARYAVVPYGRVGLHLLQLDRYQGAWDGAVGSPLVEGGLASCRFGEELPCWTLSAVAERDLRFGPAPDTTQISVLLGAGVGF